LKTTSPVGVPAAPLTCTLKVVVWPASAGLLGLALNVLLELARLAVKLATTLNGAVILVKTQLAPLQSPLQALKV
jgi:hypothetical protein